MKKEATLTATLIAIAISVAAISTSALAGKKGSVKYNDEKSTGGVFYDPKDYGPCDIDKLSAKEKRNKITLNVAYRSATQYGSAIDVVYGNTKGGKKSDPEYQITRGYEEDEMLIYKRKPVSNPKPGYLAYELIDTGKTAKLKHKSQKDILKLPVSAFGKTNKVGLQVQTCGEGSVDIAPGKDYFDDAGYDGTIKYESLYVKV